MYKIKCPWCSETSHNSINPIHAEGGGGKFTPLDLFVDNFFIVGCIDLKFSVNSYKCFLDPFKSFQDRAGSEEVRIMYS